MVRGTTVCGTFVTARHLQITAVGLVCMLTLGAIGVGVGVGQTCDYYSFPNHYLYEKCFSTHSVLTINGGILLGFSVVGFIIVGVLSRRLREPPTPQQPVNTPYSYAMPGGPVVVAQQSQQLQSLPN